MKEKKTSRKKEKSTHTQPTPPRIPHTTVPATHPGAPCAHRRSHSPHRAGGGTTTRNVAGFTRGPTAISVTIDVSFGSRGFTDWGSSSSTTRTPSPFVAAHIAPSIPGAAGLSLGAADGHVRHTCLMSVGASYGKLRDSALLPLGVLVQIECRSASISSRILSQYSGVVRGERDDEGRPSEMVETYEECCAITMRGSIVGKSGRALLTFYLDWYQEAHTAGHNAGSIQAACY
ncbi:hypothetical protein DFH07DRAFT_842287 [Mycena maculata]|uniref:Uncharacterized protein n=1 Tax=Mycena maculata TaxID=230809 RepID=A0AAD7MZ76_9AGAR|nr:hypothetical protein DFH07DRAFT_842287 [Mycena maculata]